LLALHRVPIACDSLSTDIVWSITVRDSPYLPTHRPIQPGTLPADSCRPARAHEVPCRKTFAAGRAEGTARRDATKHLDPEYACGDRAGRAIGDPHQAVRWYQGPHCSIPRRRGADRRPEPACGIQRRFERGYRRQSSYRSLQRSNCQPICQRPAHEQSQKPPSVGRPSSSLPLVIGCVVDRRALRHRR
jgi:hypothetical protein